MRSFSQALNLALAAFSLFIAPRRLQAQDSATTATLTGIVRDAAGAAIPGATIALRGWKERWMKWPFTIARCPSPKFNLTMRPRDLLNRLLQNARPHRERFRRRNRWQ